MKFPVLKNPFVLLAVGLAANVWYAAIYLPAQARKEWETAREELLARGEKLSPADFAAPQVEDEMNFFADPLWQELFDREAVTNMGVTHHKSRKPEGMWKISVLRRPIEGEERKTLEEKYPEFRPLGEDKNRYELLRRHWAKAGKAGDTERASQFVLEALAPSEPVITRLRELGTRADAYYPLEYGEGAMMRVEHLPLLLSASQWLGLHQSVLLSQGRSDEAFGDAQLLFRLAEALNREQTFLVVLGEMSIIKMGLMAVNRGIRKHAWTEHDLLEFDRKLAKIDVPARLAAGLRAERALTAESTFLLLEKEGLEALASLREKGEGLGYKEVLVRPVFGFYRIYWMPADKIFYVRAIQKWVEALDEAPDRGLRDEFFPDFLEEYFEANRSAWAKVRRLQSKLMLSSLTGSFSRAAHLQVGVLQTRVAIALERHRINSGGYPERLEALVPEFLPALPLDPVTLSPFHYRRENSEKFLLWSVGWDEVDENGKIGKERVEGDWVWGQ